MLSACPSPRTEVETVSSPHTVTESEVQALPLPGEEPDPTTPTSVTDAFYSWYTSPGHTGKLLGSHQEEYLTTRLRRELAEHRGNYDPILMAQERLRDFEVEAWYEQQAEAGVVVHFHLGDAIHDISVQLRRGAGEPAWQIDQIMPGDLASPGGVANRFYRDYLELYRDTHDPLADGLYRQMEGLSPALVEQVDALRAEGVAYDPFLMAESPTQRFRVDEVDIEGERATVVLLCWWADDLTPSPLTLSLEREGYTWAINGIDAPTVVKAGQEAAAPEAVVEAFFAEYSAAGGYAAGAQEESDYLHPVYLANLAEQTQQWHTAGMPTNRYDPVLQSMIPEDGLGGMKVAADLQTIHFDRAQVLAWRQWTGTGRALPLNVTLQRTPAGQWQISDISSAITPLAAQSGEQTARASAAPVQRVASAFTAALAYVDTPAGAGQIGEHLGLPVVVGASQTFCTQALPLGIAADGAFVQPGAEGGQIASVVVHTTLDRHAFTVELAQTAEGWKVTDVTCANSPEGLVQAFYTWYLGSIGDPGMYRFQNPFLAGSYRDTIFLTSEFANQVDRLRETGREDPFVFARMAPLSFAVEPGPGTGQATVRLTFAGGAEQTIRVTTENENGRRLIADSELMSTFELEPAPAPVFVDTGSWPAYADAAYPFSFRVPPGWVVEARDVRGLQPDDRYQRVIAVYTPAVATARDAGLEETDSGWPAGLPVVNALVIEGEVEALNSAFVPPVASREATYNGYPVLIQQEGDEYIAYRYLFRDPKQQYWVVFVDYLSAFPGREAFAQEVAGILPGILSTFTFEE